MTKAGTKDKNKLTLKKGTTEQAMLRDEKGRRLEEKMTKKGSVININMKYDPNQNKDVKDKPREGTGETRKNKNREGEKEHGMRLRATY